MCASGGARSRSASPQREDTIHPDAAIERHVAAVRHRRINEKATRVTEMTMEQLMTDDGKGPVLYVPGKHRERILRLYGGHTIMDFDELYQFNVKIGQPYPNCYASMMYYLNETGGYMQDQWEKLSEERVLGDVFNLVQSAVRARVGECVWYE